MAVTGLRKVVSDYLDCLISLSEFASRFARLSYGIRESGDPELAYLCRAIESRIAEVRLKLISERVFREAMTSYAEAESLSAPVVTMDILVVSNGPSGFVSSRPAGEVENFKYELCDVDVRSRNLGPPAHDPKTCRVRGCLTW